MTNREVSAGRLIEILLALSALVIVVCMIYIVRPSPSHSDATVAIDSSVVHGSDGTGSDGTGNVGKDRPSSSETGRAGSTRRGAVIQSKFW